MQMLRIKRDPFRALEDWRDRHGPRFTMRSPGVPPMVFLSDPAEVREMFLAAPEVLRPGEGGSLLLPVVGEQSFMLADGRPHRHGRTVLKDAFTVATARRHESLVRELVTRDVARWPHGRAVAVHPLLRTLALRIVFRVIFGDDGDRPQAESLYGRLLVMLEVTASLVLNVPPVRKLPHGRATWNRFLRNRAEVDALLYALIDEGRDGRGAAHGTLGLLLSARDAAGAPLTRRYVRDSLMSVIVAGHETTSSALAWALLLLAHAPAAQRRAANEAHAAAEGNAESPYLSAVVYEALRHRPVFLFAIPRVVKAPVDIGEHRYVPPAYLMACIYLIHHDRAWYPDPHRFRPERFVGVRPDPDLWLPWGGGRKRCPGRHLALIEMQAVLRAVLRAVRVEPASRRMEGGSWRSFIVAPARGARLVLHPR